MAKSQKYTSLNAWLNSEEGKNAQGYDDFSYIQGMDDMKKIGLDTHNLKQSLSNYEAAARKAGFGRIEYITHDGGTTVICRPTNQNYQMADADCPSLEIGRIKNGFYVQDNIPTTNNPVFVNNGKGLAGIASAMSISINEAATNISQYADNWKKEYRDVKVIAQKVKTTTRTSMGTVRHLNPTVYSKHVINDYQDSIDPRNMDALSSEGRLMLLQQGMLGFYNHTLYNNHKKQLTGYNGAPKDEKQLTRQLDTIMNVARGASNFKELDSYVKSKFPWIYANIWQGELQNLYKGLEDAGVHITQGGKKEGSAGIIGLGQDLTPLASFLNTGRKIQQNQRFNPNKKHHDHASAKNQIFTAEQIKRLKSDLKNKPSRIRSDLYYAGEINESDMEKAIGLIERDYAEKIKAASSVQQQKKLKRELGLLRKELSTKGLGKDASFLSASASADFGGMEYLDVLKGEVSKTLIDSRIKEKLMRKYLNQARNKQKSEAEISKMVDEEFNRFATPKDGVLSAEYRGYIKKTIHSLYGLKQGVNVKDFDLTTEGMFKNIQTSEKLNNRIFTARGRDTDDRTVSTELSDIAMGYTFLAHGYRPEDIWEGGKIGGKLKMHIGAQQTEISEKNIRDHIIRKFAYIASKATPDQIKAALKSNQRLGKVLQWHDDDAYWELSDSKALKRYGYNGARRNTPFKFLQDIVALGQELGVYQAGEAFSIRDVDGTTYATQNIPLPEARAREVFSGVRYEGTGDETRSGSKFDWKAYNSLRGTIAQMERMGVNQEAVDAYRAYVDSIGSRLEQKSEEYKTYTRNLKNISKTYSQDINDFVKDSKQLGTAEIIPIEELMRVNSNLSGAYENNGRTSGLRFSDDQLALMLKAKQLNRWNELQKKYSKEELLAKGMASEKDVAVLVDLGEGREISHYDYDNNKFYRSRYTALGVGDYSIDDTDPDHKLISLDDQNTENYRIVNHLKNYYNSLGGENSKEMAVKASRGILEAQLAMAESIERGSKYDEYHTLSDDKSSGYMLLTALQQNFSDNFKKTYGKEHAPMMIISTSSANSMLREGLLGNDEKVKEQIYKMYARNFGVGATDEEKLLNAKALGAKDINQIIKPILRKFDYSRGGYKGDILEEFQFLRNPIIKFAADQLGGGLVFTSDDTVAKAGSMRINPDLAAAAKGDMDGDRVAFMIAALTGDTGAAREAMVSYYEHLAERQATERKKEEAKSRNLKTELSRGLFDDPEKIVENYGELGKVTSVMDYYVQNVRSIAMNEGAKGAGIYGDLLFAVEKILEENNLNQGAIGNNKGVFLGNMASNIAHTLYQEGIAIKNIKGADGEQASALEVAEIINDIVTRSGQSATWNTRSGMTDFLKTMEKVKMSGSDGVFKGNIIANLGLNDLDLSHENDKDIVNVLDTVAQSELKELERLYGKDSEEYKRLQDDLTRIQAIKENGKGDLQNISRELLVALMVDKEHGLASYIKDFGSKIHGRYAYIPGKTHEFEKMLQEAAVSYASQFSEEDKKKFPKEYAQFLKIAEAQAKEEQRFVQLGKAKSVARYYTSPSKQTNKVAYSSLYGEGADSREVEGLVAKLADNTTSREEKSAIRRELQTRLDLEANREKILSQIQGTFSHLAAEHYMNQAKGLEAGAPINKKAYRASIKKELDTTGAWDESTAVLQALGFSKTEAHDFLRKSEEKGAANAAFFRDYIEKNNGQIIGSEIHLAGAGAINGDEVTLNRGIADLLFKTVDENGHTTFHVTDWKNTKDGKIHLANLLQGTDYIEMLKDLNREKLQNENFSAGSYLNAGRGDEGSIYQKLWVSMIDSFVPSVAKEQKISEDAARVLLEQEFAGLAEHMGVTDASFVGHLITQSNNGKIFQHDFRSLATNPNHRAMYEAYRNGDRDAFLNGKTVEELEKDVIGDHEITNIVNEVFAGGVDNFRNLFSQEYSDFLKQLEALRKLKEKKAELEHKLREEQNRADVDLKKTEEIQHQIDEASQNLEIAQNGVNQTASEMAQHKKRGIDGKLYSFGDIQQIVGETTDISDTEEYYRKLESYSNRDNLEDHVAKLKKLTQQQIVVERELAKEGLSESERRSKQRYLDYYLGSQISDQFARYEAVRSSVIDGMKNPSESDKAWLDEQNFTYGSDNYNAFVDQTNRSLDLKARNEGVNFFKYATSQYKAQYKLEEELSQNEEQQSKLRLDNDKEDLEALQLRHQLIEEELMLLRGNIDPEQFKLIPGYTAQRDADARRLAELQTQADKKGKNSGGGGQGGGGDFLGIDSATSRWVSRIMNGGLIYTFIRTVRKGLHDITEKAKQLDQAMTNLRIVTGKSAENARSLIGQYAELGKQLGATTIEVTQAATAWLRQGYDIAQVNDLITASMYLSKLGMIDTATATQSLTSAMHGFKLEASDAMDIVDKFTALDVKAATTAGDIAQGLSQFANIARLGGVSIDQAAAYVATIADVNQMSGITVGQSLKTIMSRYGNVKAGAYNKLNVDSESSDTSEKLNDVERVLNKMGISIRKTNLEFKDFDDVLDEIADRWGTLDNVTKRAMANAFAGVRQNEAFLVLMENYDKYQELLNVSETSQGTAERKYQSYRESYAFARNEFVAAMEQLANGSEVSKLLTDLTHIGTNLVTVLRNIYPFIPMIVSLFSKYMILTGRGLGTKLLNSGALMNPFKDFKNLQKVINREGLTGVDGKGFAYISKASKAQVGMLVGEMVLNQLMTSISQFATAATTHKNAAGETVESSKEAQRRGASVSAALSMIPIVGEFFGPILGEQVAAKYDASRDTAYLATDRANKNLSKIKSISSKLDSIAESELGSAERHALVKELRTEIFDKDNQSLRNLLASHLGTSNLSSVLNNIDQNGQEANESLRQIQVAQLEIQKSEVYGKYASRIYDNQADVNSTLSDAVGYDGLDADAIWSGIGVGVGTYAAAGVSGALLGTLIGMLGGPVGAIIGAAIGTAIAGAGVGVATGIHTSQTQAEANRKQYNGNWDELNIEERIDLVNELIEEQQSSLSALHEQEEAERLNYLATDKEIRAMQRSYEVNGYFEGDIGVLWSKADDIVSKLEQYSSEISAVQDKLSTYEKLLDVLNQQLSLQVEITTELNNLTLQESMLSAKASNGKYINEMSIAELKAIGIDKTLLAYAQAIEANGGLTGINIWSDSSKTSLSKTGYEYLYNQIRKQGDDEINAVLSGYGYTLQEALALRNKYGADSFEVQKILTAFSDALGVSISQLDDSQLKELQDTYGMLTLSDTLSSTSELTEKMTGLADVMNAVANGAGTTTTWMESIISKYPSLIRYMGNTSQLFGQTIELMKQLSQNALNAQGAEVLGSAEFFHEYENSIYATLESKNPSAAAALRKASPASFADILTWVQTQYDINTGELTQDAKDVAELISDTITNSGIKLVDTQMKAFYDQLIDYQTKTLDKEIQNLNEQKEALKEINSQREYENKLVEARLKLEDAAKQKKRVYRAGVGWVYESDQSAVEAAQKELDAVNREKQIAVLEEQIAIKQKQKDDLSSIYEKENYELLEKLYTTATEKGFVSSDTTSAISDIASGIQGIEKPLTEYLNDQLKKKETDKTNAISAAKEAWEELQKAVPGTSNYNTALENFHNAMDAAKEAGATESDFKNWDTFKGVGARGIASGASARSIANGKLTDQMMAIKQQFMLKDVDGTWRSGETTGDFLTNSEVINSLDSDTKTKDAVIWTEDGTAYNIADNWFLQRRDNEEFTEYLGRVADYLGTKHFMIAGTLGDYESAYYDNGKLYKVIGGDNTSGLGTSSFGQYYDGVGGYFGREKYYETSQTYANGKPAGMPEEVWNKIKGRYGYANGSYGLDSSALSLVNELGTEAIVTPQGTLTALPSKTGIIPADITKNLWELGEIAPSLLRFLGDRVSSGQVGQSIFGNMGTDESLNIANLVMNIDADSGFDLEKLVTAIRSKVALTKNSR